MSLSGEFPLAVEDSPSALLTLQVGRKEWGGGSEEEKDYACHDVPTFGSGEEGLCKTRVTNVRVPHIYKYK